MTRINPILASLGLIILFPVLALNSDQHQPYHISADRAFYDRDHHVSFFTGHVVATQGSSRATGDKMKLYLDGNNRQIRELWCYGHPATYATELEQRGHLYTEASTIHYNPASAKATLIAHAKVVQGEHRLTGPHILYNLRDNLVKTHTQFAHDKTKLIIQPQDMH